MFWCLNYMVMVHSFVLICYIVNVKSRAKHGVLWLVDEEWRHNWASFVFLSMWAELNWSHLRFLGGRLFEDINVHVPQRMSFSTPRVKREQTHAALRSRGQTPPIQADSTCLIRKRCMSHPGGFPASDPAHLQIRFVSSCVCWASTFPNLSRIK